MSWFSDHVPIDKNLLINLVYKNQGKKNRILEFGVEYSWMVKYVVDETCFSKSFQLILPLIFFMR